MMTASTWSGFTPLGGQGRADGVGAEFDGGEAGQLPVEPALRGAGGGEDDNIIVVRGVAHGFLFRSLSTYFKVIVSPITGLFGAGPTGHDAGRGQRTGRRRVERTAAGPVLAIAAASGVDK